PTSPPPRSMPGARSPWSCSVQSSNGSPMKSSNQSLTAPLALPLGLESFRLRHQRFKDLMSILNLYPCLKPHSRLRLDQVLSEYSSFSETSGPLTLPLWITLISTSDSTS